MQQMEEVVVNCMAGDNSIRQQADHFFQKTLDANPASAATDLTKILSASQNSSARGMAAILLRKFWSKKFFTLDLALQEGIKKEMLGRMTNENDKKNLRHVCDLIVEISSMSEWPELIPFLTQMLNTVQDKTQMVLYVFGELVTIKHDQMSPEQINNMVQLAGQSFGNANVDIQLEGIKFFGKAIIHVANPGDQYGEVVTNLYGLLSGYLMTNIDVTQQILKVLGDIAYHKASFFKTKINETAQTMQSIGVNGQVDEEVRQLALELMITIIEREPALIRKNKVYIENSINVALQLMTTLEDDRDAWNSEYDANVDDSPNFDAGQIALCRIGDLIAVSKFLPILMPKVDQLLGMADWKCKQAGIIAIAQTSDYLHTGKADKNAMLQKVAGLMNDPHHRVRYAVVHCMGIMCTDFGKKFVNKWHNDILGVFMGGMSDTQNPRLQAHAAVCVVNLAERVSSKLLRPNLENLLRKLFDTLNQPSNIKFVQENCLSAISEVASNADEFFVKYYDTFVPSLVKILESATGQDFLSLRLEALRCLSYIGESVKLDIFRDVANQTMKLSIPILSLPDTLELNRIFNSWRRIFRAMKTETGPYLPAVYESIFKVANQDVRLLESESDYEDEVNSRDVPVNATKVEEKVACLNLMEAMASNSGTAFLQYVERTASILLPLIDNPQDTAVQESAVEALPSLVYCMFEAHQKSGGNPQKDVISKLFMMIVQKVVEAMTKDENAESVAAFAGCIENLFKIDAQLTKFCVNEGALKVVTAGLMKCLQDSAERMDVRNGQMTEQGIDEEDIDELKKENENEASLSTSISDAVGMLIRIWQDAFLPLLGTSMDCFQYMLGPEGLDIQKRAALYIFCEVIESCSAQSFQALLPFLCESLKNASLVADRDVRQAAMYGFGVLVEKQGGNIPGIADVVQIAFSQFTDQRFNQENNEDVQDNAAAAIGKILKFCPGSVPAAEVYPKWLNCFPIRNDDECSQWCYSEFLNLIEKEQKDFIGANMANLPRIMSFIAESLCTSMSTNAIDEKFCQMMLKIKTSPMASQVLAAMPQLPSEIKQKIGV